MRSSKDKFRLAIKILADLVAEPIGVTKIGLSAENVREPVLQSDQIYQRQAFTAIEVAREVNV